MADSNSSACASLDSRAAASERSSTPSTMSLSLALSLDIAFQRKAADDDTTELRGQCPNWIVGVLDAAAASDRTNRTEVVNRVLEAWAKQEVTRATVMLRVARGNPAFAEAAPDLWKAH